MCLQGVDAISNDVQVDERQRILFGVRKDSRPDRGWIDECGIPYLMFPIGMIQCKRYDFHGQDDTQLVKQGLRRR